MFVTRRRKFISCRALPVPSATALSGSSATWTGRPVSSFRRLSSPLSSAPPPASVSPRSTRSAASSGGHRSRVVRTASMMDDSGSAMASRISSDEIFIVLGRPATRSLPLTSMVSSLGSSMADPRRILISSAVLSPIMRLYARFMYEMMASSSSSPAVRTERLYTIPASEMSATSVVPPPMSTIIHPEAS